MKLRDHWVRLGGFLPVRRRRFFAYSGTAAHDRSISDKRELVVARSLQRNHGVPGVGGNAHGGIAVATSAEAAQA
jgi:hypothetical protein